MRVAQFFWLDLGQDRERSDLAVVDQQWES
jgi:hypothetical protein